MPRWAETPMPEGRIHHELIGDRIGAIVEVDAPARRTVITVLLLVDGTDDATVDRCRRRAERTLVEIQRDGPPPAPAKRPIVDARARSVRTHEL